MKVDHAGEHGAVNIYRGQLAFARWTAPGMVAELKETLAHELTHRSLFGAELKRRGCARCRSYLLCGVGGFTLGLVTGLLGRHAIAATTLAVENVVLRHLSEQLAELRGVDIEAFNTVSAIVADETRHRDQAAAHVQTGQFWPTVLTPLVALSTEAVIWVGMQL